MKNQLISTINFAKAVKAASYLIKNLWKEGTTLIVRGPRESDKTEKALEIAAEVVSDDRKAVYVNTEDNLDAHVDRLVTISGLSILSPRHESPDDTTDYADLVINAIEEVIAETEIRTFIIDSVSRIAALSFGRNASAAYVMKRLVALQRRTGCSFLIIAHNSTKAADRALSSLASAEITLTTDSPFPVWSRPVATAENARNAGFQPAPESPTPSDLSEMSDPSDSSETHSLLSRSERRRLRRQRCKANRLRKAALPSSPESDPTPTGFQPVATSS